MRLPAQLRAFVLNAHRIAPAPRHHGLSRARILLEDSSRLDPELARKGGMRNHTSQLHFELLGLCLQLMISCVGTRKGRQRWR